MLIQLSDCFACLRLISASCRRVEDKRICTPIWPPILGGTRFDWRLGPRRAQSAKELEKSPTPCTHNLGLSWRPLLRKDDTCIAVNKVDHDTRCSTGVSLGKPSNVVLRHNVWQNLGQKVASIGISFCAAAVHCLQCKSPSP